MRNVTNDVVLGIKNRQRRHALVIHELESCSQRIVATKDSVSSIHVVLANICDSLDGQNILRPNIQVL